MHTTKAIEITRPSYFQENETACRCGCGLDNWNPNLMEKLLRTRVHYMKPIVVTSLCRCTAHNAKVGGSPTSTHLPKLRHVELKGVKTSLLLCSAVDIQVPRDPNNYLMLLGALVRAGFPRLVISNRRIHADVDIEKPRGVFFYVKE